MHHTGALEDNRSFRNHACLVFTFMFENFITDYLQTHRTAVAQITLRAAHKLALVVGKQPNSSFLEVAGEWFARVIFFVFAVLECGPVFE